MNPQKRNQEENQEKRNRLIEAGREKARRVKCPMCGAQPGQPCISVRKGNPPRQTNHAVRVMASR